jgi:hypothetical protein
MVSLVGVLGIGKARDIQGLDFQARRIPIEPRTDPGAPRALLPPRFNLPRLRPGESWHSLPAIYLLRLLESDKGSLFERAAPVLQQDRPSSGGKN